jgi:hypothetical protein
MQTVDLARAAASAEVLMLKQMVRRQIMRAVYGAVAVVFVIGALVLLHVVGFEALAPHLTPLEDSAVLLGVDVVVAVIFGLLASRSSPDAIEVEAKLLRDQSLRAMRQSLAVATLLSSVGRMAATVVGKKRAAGLTLAAMAATFLAGNRR